MNDDGDDGDYDDKTSKKNNNGLWRDKLKNLKIK
jgi:hypothetical protein